MQGTDTEKGSLGKCFIWNVLGRGRFPFPEYESEIFSHIFWSSERALLHRCKMFGVTWEKG